MFRIGRLPWVVGAIHRVDQALGCFGDDGIALPIPELRLEMVAGGWRTGPLRAAIAKAEQPLEIKELEWQQKAGLLYRGRVRVAYGWLWRCDLKSTGGCDWAYTRAQLN